VPPLWHGLPLELSFELSVSAEETAFERGLYTTAIRAKTGETSLPVSGSGVTAEVARF